MPKKCIKCRRLAATSNVKRSYHKFPKNDDKRLKQWMSALYLIKTPNFNTSYVCSDHFREQDFFDTDEQRQKRRLRPEAIPSESIENRVVNNGYISLDVPIRSPVMPKDENDEIINESICESWVTHSIDSNPSDKLTSTDVQEGVCQINKESSFDSASDYIICNGQRLKVTKSLSKCNTHEDIKKLSDHLKRGVDSEDMISKKRIRVSNGKTVEFFSREDFSSNAAWHKFMRYVTTVRRHRATARNHSSRIVKRMETLKGVINNLKEQGNFDAAKYLHASS